MRLSHILWQTIRWQRIRTCAHLLLWELQIYNSLLNNHRQENIRSHQKKDTHIQGQRRSPSKTAVGRKSHLESNPIPTRHAQRTKENLVRARRPHRDWARHASQGLSASCRGRVSGSLPRGQLDTTERLNWTELITHSSCYNTWKVFSEEEAYYVNIISV